MDTATGKNMAGLQLSFGPQEFEYHYGYSCEQSIREILLEKLSSCSSIVLLIDPGAREHADFLVKSAVGAPQILPIVVDAGEQQKRLAQVDHLLHQAVVAGAQRDSAVVAIGGGVVGNLAGMVAALLFRGLPLVHLPTTPVAAFDSVLSAKQAVNLGIGKNLCGTFLTPRMVLCDLAWLRTVPQDLMITGLFEMAKNVLAVRPDYRESFSRAVGELAASGESSLRVLLEIGVQSKAPFLAIDPKEKREALIFEYGHTVGHALEFASAGKMSHGEAVGWGMLVAADISHRLCGFSSADLAAHRELVTAVGLSRQRLEAIDRRAVFNALANDNKKGYLPTGTDQVAMVLLEALGEPAETDGRPLIAVSRTLVEESIESLFASVARA